MSSQAGGPPPSVDIPISRDNILFVGALLFLILSIAAVLFLITHPDGGEPLGQFTTTPTQVAELQAPTNTSVTQLPEPSFTPTHSLSSPEVVRTAYPAPIRTAYPAPIRTAYPAPVRTAYPAPQEETPSIPGNGLPPVFSPTLIIATLPVELATATPDFVPPTYTPFPTYTPYPTPLPLPTYTPYPTPTPEPPTDTPQPTETPLPNSPTPTEPPVDIVQGMVRWDTSQGPIVLQRPLRVEPGSVLIIGPGTEVRLEWGASISVQQAHLVVAGTPDQPVRFVSHTGHRWDGIYGLQGSVVGIEYAEIRGGGAGGTVLMSEKGELSLRQSKVIENGGTIVLTDSRVEIRHSEIWGNDMPSGGAINATYTQGNILAITENRIGRNRIAEGIANLNITHQHSHDPLILDVQGNLVHSGETEGANLLISTNGPLEGTIACNSLIGGNFGLQIRANTLQLPGFKLHVSHNMIKGHTPPIIPHYLKYGIGRGATSEVQLDMSNNWWGKPSGPYHPEDNPEGRGESVGNNITYRPWLTTPPSCVPWP